MIRNESIAEVREASRKRRLERSEKCRANLAERQPAGLVELMDGKTLPAAASLAAPSTVPPSAAPISRPRPAVSPLKPHMDEIAK